MLFFIYQKQDVNGVIYLEEYPPWKTVYTYFKKWKDSFLFERLNHSLRRHLRVLMDRDPKTSAGIIDSQSVKTAEKVGKRIRWRKKIKGRKRHIIVDTQGFLIGCHITKASILDQEGFIGILE